MLLYLWILSFECVRVVSFHISFWVQTYVNQKMLCYTITIAVKMRDLDFYWRRAGATSRNWSFSQFFLTKKNVLLHQPMQILNFYRIPKALTKFSPPDCKITCKIRDNLANANSHLAHCRLVLLFPLFLPNSRELVSLSVHVQLFFLYLFFIGQNGIRNLKKISRSPATYLRNMKKLSPIAPQ